MTFQIVGTGKGGEWGWDVLKLKFWLDVVYERTQIHELGQQRITWKKTINNGLGNEGTRIEMCTIKEAIVS